MGRCPKLQTFFKTETANPPPALSNRPTRPSQVPNIDHKIQLRDDICQVSPGESVRNLAGRPRNSNSTVDPHKSPGGVVKPPLIGRQCGEAERLARRFARPHRGIAVFQAACQSLTLRPGEAPMGPPSALPAQSEGVTPPQKASQPYWQKRTSSPVEVLDVLIGFVSLCHSWKFHTDPGRNT